MRQNKADAIVETASGTLLNVKDSANAYFEDFSVYGKSEQVQTTGAQLLNYYKLAELSPQYYAIEQGELKVKGSDNVAWTSVPEYGTLAAGTYTLSGNNAEIRDASKNTVIATCIGDTFSKFTLNEDTAIKIKVGYGLDKYPIVVKAMLNKGDSKKPYEPYTGGKPSPSPEYPQEIMSAGRFNEDTGKYEIDVKVTGKNLIPFPYPAISGNKGTKNGIMWEVLTDGGIKLTGTANPKTFYLDLDNNLKIGNILIAPGGTDGRITVNKDVSYDGRLAKAYIAVNKGVTVNRVYYPQIEHGTVFTAHEPYKEQTLTLTSDRPLAKWDRLVEQDGQIGWLYKGKQYIVTGEESLRIPVDLPSYIYGNTTSSFLAISNNDFSDKKGYLNKLPYIPEVWISQSNKEGYCLNTTNQLHVRFANTRLNIEDTASISEREKAIKAHIKQQYDAGTPYMLWYESLQEEFVPLPQEQQNAIRALTTYYPTTVVTNSEDTEMQLTYVADTKNYTDRKIEEAVSAQVQNLANLLSLMPLSTQAAMIEADTNNILDNMEVQK